MKKVVAAAMVAFIALVGAGVALATWVVPRYDQMVVAEENARKEWAQVETLLQRRYSLIPQLVSTVKGFAQQERAIFVGLEAAHQAYKSSTSMNDRVAASRKIEGYLPQLRYVGRLHPNLKSDALFSNLMTSLESTEDQIASQRMVFNEAVSTYNQHVKTAQGRVVAALTSKTSLNYFEPPAAANLNPPVDFAGDRKDDVQAFNAAKAKRNAPPKAGPGATEPASSKTTASAAQAVRYRGMVEGDGGRQAILQLGDGRTVTVRTGESLLELRTKVVSVDALGVVLEEYLAGGGVNRFRITK